MPAEHDRTRMERRGSWIPWIFVAGFLVVVLVNGTMIWIATATWTGIATNRSYDKGLTYNRNLAAAARQEQLGWQAAIRTALDGERRGTVEVALHDDAGTPIGQAQATLTFERPTHEGYDFTLPLNQTGRGAYTADFVVPLIGLWDLRLVVTRDDDLFVAIERVLLE